MLPTIRQERSVLHSGQWTCFHFSFTMELTPGTNGTWCSSGPLPHGCLLSFRGLCTPCLTISSQQSLRPLEMLWPGRAGISRVCRTSSAPSGSGVRSATLPSMTWVWKQSNSRRSEPGVASSSGTWRTSRAMGTPNRYARPTDRQSDTNRCAVGSWWLLPNALGIASVFSRYHQPCCAKTQNAHMPLHA